MAGEVAFTPTVEDYQEACRAHFMDAVRRPRFRWRWAIILVVFFIIGSGLGALLGPVDQAWIMGLAYLVLGIILIPIMLGVTLLLLPRKAARLFRQNRLQALEHRFTWNNEGAAYQTDKAYTRIEWGDYHRTCEGRRTFLLFVNDQLYQFVPKRVLTAAQIEEFRALLVIGTARD